MQAQQLLLIIRKYWVYIVTAIIAAGMMYTVMKPAEKKPEVYKPAIAQKDGSTVLEVKPDAKAKPAMNIPKKSTVERVVKITVQAKNPIQAISGTVEVHEIRTVESLQTESPKMAQVECPPVTLDMALIRDENGDRRVVVSSDDGNIISGVDIPVEDAKPIKEKAKWSIGIVADPISQTGGVYLDRDFGFIRVGGQVNQLRQYSLVPQFFIKLGINF